MDRLLEDISALAAKINPRFTMPEHWSERVRELHHPESFLKQVKTVLKAEIEQSFFQRQHFKKTVKQKNDLSFKQCRLLGELIAAVFPGRFDYVNQAGLLGAANAKQIKEVGDIVSRDGMHVLPELLATDTIQKIQTELAQHNYLNRNTKQIQSDISGDSGLEGAWWIKDAQQVATSDILQQLAFDPSLLGIAQTVLGAMPIHVQTNAWWTFPNYGNDDSAESVEKRNAQWFHQDMEFIDFVKVFVYLSDVSEENGPHVYVKESVHDYEAKLPGVSVSTRVSDEDIMNAFGVDRIQTITGESGTVAIVNTRGYHKGAPVLTGHRMLLQLEYASSLYFNPVPAFPVTNLPVESQALSEQYPRMFLNYHPAGFSTSRSWRGWTSKLGNLFSRPSGQHLRKAA